MLLEHQDLKFFLKSFDHFMNAKLQKENISVQRKHPVGRTGHTKHQKFSILPATLLRGDTFEEHHRSFSEDALHSTFTACFNTELKQAEDRTWSNVQ
ncbi:hypothetical protein ATANTOWER_022167 [Ataeniobius toweri]|uniref:Uncharacterized protein n=1 Tax=Ataeniobius toweri TaxID=208326 RepID=A0ABU7A352_9TELE|nr:hypothetical protein [Ataeniobius toweri]